MDMQLVSPVKQALLEKFRQEVVPSLERLIQGLPETLMDLAAAECQVRSGFLQAARLCLEAWGSSADRSVKRPACPQCSLPMRHKGHPEGAVVTTVGPVKYRRPRWRCEECSREIYPHDAHVRFQDHGVSWPLAQVIGRLAAQHPAFEEARDTLAVDYGVRLAKETIREIAEAAGSQVLEQEDAEREAVIQRQTDLPDSALEPDKVCVFADGTTVHAEGDWHEIRVGTVTAEDAEGKRLARHSRARFLPVTQMGWLLILLARGVGYHKARTRAFIADGAVWLWKIASCYFGSAVQILDWYHLAEHVHKAAGILWGEGTPEAHDWAQCLKDEFWNGRVSAGLSVVGEALARARSPARRAGLEELQTYVEHNRERMDYPLYRSLGLPIGSGQVEAQCKTLVGARCKQAGMRNWTYRGAEGVLRLRAALHDGTYTRLWQNRLSLAA